MSKIVLIYMTDFEKGGYFMKINFLGINSHVKYGKPNRKNHHKLKTESQEDLTIWDVARTLKSSLRIIVTQKTPEVKKLSTIEVFTIEYLKCIADPRLSQYQSTYLRNEIITFINREYDRAVLSKLLPKDDPERDVYVMRTNIERDYYDFYYEMQNEIARVSTSGRIAR